MRHFTLLWVPVGGSADVGRVMRWVDDVSKGFVGPANNRQSALLRSITLAPLVIQSQP